jgi:hypothetical protein
MLAWTHRKRPILFCQVVQTIKVLNDFIFRRVWRQILHHHLRAHTADMSSEFVLQGSPAKKGRTE